MASSNSGEMRAVDLQGTYDADVPSASSGSASGVRVDRERKTTPAPPRSTDAWASFPSARPTSVPDYDVASYAFETSLRHAAVPRLPLDLAVPVRTKLAAPSDLELRASFLLLHVDGCTSVGEIAELTSIPLDEVLATFAGLTAVGLVELGGVTRTGREACP